MSGRGLRVIVLSDHGYVNGGASQVAIAGLNALAAAGIDVTFVCGTGPADAAIDRKRVSVVDFGGHDLLGHPSRWRAAANGLWNADAGARFGALLAEFDPDNTLIHLHTWTKALSSSVVRTAIDRGFMVVCTLHDYFTACPNGGFYHYARARQCALEPMSLRCMASNCDSRSYGHKLWRLARQAVQERIGLVPQGIREFITVSDYSEKILRRWLPAAANYHRVANPIAIGRAEPAAPRSHDAFTFIGRLAPEKGGALFAAAAAAAGVRAVFAGSGEEEPAIRAANPAAELLGWQDRAGVIRAIRASRAIVFPSLWHETQGLAVLEAAALGIPAIVSDACAAKEAVIDGRTGLLFRSGDRDDLASRLKALRDDPGLAAGLGRAAHERYWRTPATLERHVDQLLGCYRKIMRREHECA